MNDISLPDTSKTDTEIGGFLAWAEALVISTKDDYLKADMMCKRSFDLRKRLKADFSQSRQAAKEAKNAAAEAYAANVAQEEAHSEPLKEGERISKLKMFLWSQEQERLRRIEQDRLRVEVQKKAEDDKLRQAQVLEAQGKSIQALAHLEKPIKTALVILPPALVERQTKISEYWTYEIENENEVMREFCSPDRGKIQRAVQLYKDKAASIVKGIVVSKRVR